VLSFQDGARTQKTFEAAECPQALDA